MALEHVVPQKQLIEELLCARSAEEFPTILARGETCVVLRTEHDALASENGWDRSAEIRRVEGPEVLARVSKRPP